MSLTNLIRAAWNGARIVMRQTSPESVDIFDLLLELHASCGGDWRQLAHATSVSDQEITKLLRDGKESHSSAAWPNGHVTWAPVRNC
jgi:hypothetical protein